MTLLASITYIAKIKQTNCKTSSINIKSTNNKNKVVYMQEVISDVVKKIGGLGFIETIKVSGTDDETKIEAIDGDKTVIVKASLLTPQPELKGEFGISTLPLLAGLLNFASYKADGATFKVKRRNTETASHPEEFEFKEKNGQGASFRLMEARLVPEQPKVVDIKWDVSFTPTKSKIQEFGALAGLYSQFDQYFSVKTKDGNLIVSIGEEESTTHRASMVLADAVDGELKGELLWPTSQFLQILKMGDGHDFTVSITSKGAMLVNVITSQANYSYILPARRR
jgi:hypothetical protein